MKRPIEYMPDAQYWKDLTEGLSIARLYKAIRSGIISSNSACHIRSDLAKTLLKTGRACSGG